MALSSSLLYQDYIKGTSPDELKIIANIKRFFECMTGDPEFRAEVESNMSGCGPLLESRGVFGVDPTQLMALFSRGSSEAEPSESDLQDKPQGLLWYRWCKTHEELRRAWRKRSDGTPNKRFNQWHRRQVNRCGSQLGNLTNEQLIHATVVFELTQGCSLQCPFCGLAAEPLKKVFPYTKENARLWREVLDVSVKHLGDTVGTGVCYWATDPTDNPDYLKFVADYGQKTGFYPQTTTSAPLRKLQWTQDLLGFRRQHNTSVDRFSVLSLDGLRRIHKTFSAEELLFTQLVLQYIDVMKKAMARSGRNRHSEVEQEGLETFKDHTIACVTGYLINMAKGTVRLISPCPPSEIAPLGYLVHTEGRFSNAGELDEFIAETMENCMPEHCGSEDILSFRCDLQYGVLANGFQLSNEYKSHKVEGKPYLIKLGGLISGGDLTFSQVLEEMSKESADILAVITTIQKLFSQGLLADKTACGGRV